MQENSEDYKADQIQVLEGLEAVRTVSYTHLTLPTNREV